MPTSPPPPVDGPGVPELLRRIRERIAARGPMTFRDFMESALYDPEHGYYTGERSPWGPAGDYVTGPQVDAAFGAAVARCVTELDTALGHPGTFALVEAGGGDGTLLADVCESLREGSPGLWQRLRVISVERSAASRRRQRQTLEARGSGTEVEFLPSLEGIPAASLDGGIVANELLDALPFHRVTVRDGELRELHVDAVGGELTEVAGPPSTPALAGYLAAAGVELAEAQVAEVCLEARRWLATAAGRLRRGFVLTIDYGDETARLYDPERPGGTLVCQRRFGLSADPLEHVGEQDITAWVDLGNLRAAGDDLGLEMLGPTSLGVFLAGFGAAAHGGPGGDPRRRLGVRHLLFSEIALAHRVVLQLKGIEPAAVSFGVARLDG